MNKKLKALIGGFVFFCASSANALDQSCVSEKAPGLHYSGSNIKLPAISKRKILGTWWHSDSGLTTSLEEVSGKIYQVRRSKYCSSGIEGDLLDISVKGKYMVRGGSHGDYYMILPSGDLGVYDNSGYIETYKKHPRLFPAN